MSNVNKFAILNCNHLMLEQTGRWFGHKGREWSNQIKHQSISSVTHADALSLFLYQLTFPSPDSFPSLPLSLLLSLPWKWAFCLFYFPESFGSVSTQSRWWLSRQPRVFPENCHTLLSVLPFRILWPPLAIQHLFFPCFACFPTA